MSRLLSKAGRVRTIISFVTESFVDEAPDVPTNAAAVAGFVLAVVVTAMSAYLVFVFAAGGSVDGPTYDSLLDRWGGVGDWMLVVGFLLVLPLLPVAVLAALIASLIGLVRARDRGQHGLAMLGLLLGLGCPLLLAALAASVA